MTNQKVLDSEEIAALGGRDPALLRMPVRAELFERRAKRLEALESLESGPAMGGYLGLAALDFVIADTTTYARVNPNLALFPGDDDGSDTSSAGAS
ncbi:MAG: hypothetical protein ABIU95_16735 [Burkholderiales bacterium]